MHFCISTRLITKYLDNNVIYYYHLYLHNKISLFVCFSCKFRNKCRNTQRCGGLVNISLYIITGSWLLRTSYSPQLEAVACPEIISNVACHVGTQTVSDYVAKLWFYSHAILNHQIPTNLTH